MYIYIIASILILLFILHLRRFYKTTNIYEIEQQALIDIDSSTLNSRVNPVIICDIEYPDLKKNIDKYKLYSPFTVSKQYNTITIAPNTDNKYIIQINNKKKVIDKDLYINNNSDLMFIRPDTKCIVSLVNPLYSQYLHIQKNINYPLYDINEKDYDKVKVIDIVVYEHNILVVPRRWFAQITTDNAVTVCKTNTIFSNILGKTL